MQALHFEKGCYLGQEIVERVRSRGLVRRQLRALRIEGGAAPEPGEKLLAGEKEAGELTSAAWSPLRCPAWSGEESCSLSLFSCSVWH